MWRQWSQKKILHSFACLLRLFSFSHDSALLSLLTACGPCSALCVSELLGGASNAFPGPDTLLALAGSVQTLIGLRWWRNDMRLTNSLFQWTRKALAAGFVMKSPDELLGLCCESIAAAQLGRVTRFFLSVITDTVQYAGTGSMGNSLIHQCIDLSQKTLPGCNVPVEHVGPISSSVAVLASLVIKGTPETESHLVSVAEQSLGALSLLAEVYARRLVTPTLSARAVMQCLLDHVARFSDFIMENSNLYQTVYTALASLVVQQPQSLVESWLLENILTPHVVSAQLLANIWTFVVRHSAPQVQIWHLDVLLDCINSLSAKQHSVCRDRIVRLFVQVFLNSSSSVQVTISQREGAIYYVPSVADGCEDIASAAASLLAQSHGQLSAKGSVGKLAVLSRLGSAQLTHALAAPFAQSVFQVYAHMGSSREALRAREQGPAVSLASSMGSWLGPGELSKFLLRLAQSSKSFLLAHLMLIRNLVSMLEPHSVGSVSVFLDQALQSRHWYHRVAAISVFRILSTQSESFDAANIRELAGRNLEAISKGIAVEERAILCDFGKILAEKMLTQPAPQSSLAQAQGVQARPSIEDFVALSRTLLQTASSLQGFSGTDMVGSARFQQELVQSIHMLEQLRKKE